MHDSKLLAALAAAHLSCIALLYIAFADTPVYPCTVHQAATTLQEVVVYPLSPHPTHPTVEAPTPLPHLTAVAATTLSLPHLPAVVAVVVVAASHSLLL